MPGLLIDNKQVEIPRGGTILEAAGKLGIKIPTICFMDGFDHFTSCMMCVVKERVSNRLLPSCSAPVYDGMIIETMSDEVKNARRNTLELLLKEHIGDCEGPCRLACPARMNIPAVIRHIEAGRAGDAVREIKKDIPFPAVLGRICPAPCENACRRGRFDSPVSIRLLERYAADFDLAGETPYLPELRPDTGKKVAVIGAGPAGLSAAYYIRQRGHACAVFDKRDEPGGMLRYAIPQERLPRAVLDAEIDIIRSIGVEFIMSAEAGRDISVDELKQGFDAVVIATGETDSSMASRFGVKLSGRGMHVDASGCETDVESVFACGSAVKPDRMVVRSVFKGRSSAYSVDRYLSGNVKAGLKKRFNSRIGKLMEGELEEFLKDGCNYSRVVPSGGSAGGFSAAEAVKESERCLHCDCRKGDTCVLRLYAGEYEADHLRYKSGERKKYEKVIRLADVVFEPGKCVKCGRCVRIAERSGERPGLAFIGRGFDVRIGVPFNEPFSPGFGKAVGYGKAPGFGKAVGRGKISDLCVKACPTGALSFR